MLRNRLVGITSLSDIIISQKFFCGNLVLVPQERLELPTYGLEDRCSIQLSYWGIMADY